MNKNNVLKSLIATIVFVVAAQFSYAQAERQSSDRAAVKAMPTEQVKIRQAQETEKPAPNHGQPAVTPSAGKTAATTTAGSGQPATTTARPATDSRNATGTAPKATTGRPAVKPATDDRK